MLQALKDYDGKTFKSINQGNLDLDTNSDDKKLINEPRFKLALIPFTFHE